MGARWPIPPNIYTNASTYSITLTVVGAGGTNQLTRTNYIVVVPPVVAGFAAGPTNGVAPLTVTFTNPSTGATNYAWAFGDGNGSALANPTNTYTNAGTYSVTLTAVGAGGTNQLTRTNYIVVVPLPVAGFTAGPTNGVAPLTVIFTNLSTGATNYAWAFGDGNGSALANPTNTYTSAGTYSVTLTAVGAGGTNQLTRTNYIVVVPLPVAGFTAGPTNGVAPLTVTFTNLSAGATNYAWAFGDGNVSALTNPANIYTSAGTYSVTLTAVGAGGTNQLTRTNYIVVVPPVVAGFTAGPTNGVAPLTVTFTNLSTGATNYAWAFGDGNVSALTNPANTYTSAGTYSVTLTAVGAGGTNRLTRTNYIGVVPPPVAGFTASPTNGIAPLTVTFTNVSTGATNYAWAFGDGNVSALANPTNTYTNAGTYSVTLTAVGAGGTNRLTRTNYIGVAPPPPVAGFTASPTNGIAPLTVTFTNLSTGATNYAWAFGDGNLSALANPTNTYTNAGAYSVTLTAIGPGGTNQLTITNLILAIPPVALGTTALLEGPGPGSDSIVLAAAAPTIAWTATTNATWLHLSPANQGGTGSTNVIFSYDANPGATRSGTLTVGSRTLTLTLTVTQAGSSYVAAPGPLTTLVSAEAGLNDPTDVSVDGAGNVYIADYGNNAIEEWAVANNSFTTLLSAGLSSPAGVAVDAVGNVYIADTYDNAIKEWTAADDTLTTLVASGMGMNLPGGVALDAVGNVYIADTGNSAIEEWTAANNAFSTLVALGMGLNQPGGVAVDAAGNVYIADTGNNAIEEWTAANSNLTTLVSAGLSSPSGVAVDGGGNVYIADAGNSAIKEWAVASNTLTTLVSAGLSFPTGVAVDGTGNLYIADAGNGIIEELPRAFVDPTPRSETAGAGSDELPVVLPVTVNLRAPFAPTSDQAWLTITGITNGVVSFAFTANTGSTPRMGHITLLGQPITITQTTLATPPVAGFRAGPTNGVAPLAVLFTNLSTGATNYAWAFGDGNISALTNPTNTYTNAGAYSVTLSAVGPAGTNQLTLTNYIVVTNPMPPTSLVRVSYSAVNGFQFIITNKDGTPITASEQSRIQVYATTNPAARLTNWTALTNATVLTNGVLGIQDPDNLLYPRRFYRSALKP